MSTDNDMLNFMKDLIQLRKEVAGMIQHGKVSLEEVEPDVVAVEWQSMKATFSKPTLTTEDRLVLERGQADLISLGECLW